jgi:hypothetical protein
MKFWPFSLLIDIPCHSPHNLRGISGIISAKANLSSALEAENKLLISALQAEKGRAGISSRSSLYFNIFLFLPAQATLSVHFAFTSTNQFQIPSTTNFLNFAG